MPRNDTIYGHKINTPVQQGKPKSYRNLSLIFEHLSMLKSGPRRNGNGTLSGTFSARRDAVLFPKTPVMFPALQHQPLLQSPMRDLCITDSLRLEKTSKISSPTANPTPPCLLNLVPKGHIHMVFEPLQGWGLHHCPGQPGPRPKCSFRREMFPSIQSEPPLRESSGGLQR